MAINISTFPSLSDKLLQRNKILIAESSYILDFSYDDYVDDGQQSYPLENTNRNSLFYSLCDPRGIWTPDTHNLHVLGKFNITNPLGLYGEMGIAPNSSILGLAIRWCSSTSKKRGVVFIGNLNKNTDTQEIPFNITFNKAELRGSIIFYYELFINLTCVASQTESYLASKKGTIVGEQQICILEIDAKEQSFPIELFEDSQAPLWKLFISGDDLQDVIFGEEAVKIQLNKAHRDFKFINQDGKNKNFSPALLREVLASAVSLYIDALRNKVQEDHNASLADFLNSDDTSDWTPGCVAEVVKGFQKEPMCFNFSSPVETSISIHKYFDLKLDNL